MRKIQLTILAMQFITIALHAQTHGGISVGTLGTNHSYFGYYAGHAALSSTTNNTFFGANSGRTTDAGSYNTAFGAYTLVSNTTGHSNTAIGDYALYLNTTGYGNTATGKSALYSNTTGFYNVAMGYFALRANTTGIHNTAIGSRALLSNTDGHDNVANGDQALEANRTGDYNTATGSNALQNNTTGNGNTAFGFRSLTTNIGSYNSAFGHAALHSDSPDKCSGSYNTAFGSMASSSTTDFICTLSNTTAIGFSATVTASNQVRFGNSSVTSIGGQVSWSTLSDGRFKKNIKQNVSGLAFINQLKPASYTFDKEAVDKFMRLPDSLIAIQAPSRTAPREQIGFVAQEVDSVVKKNQFVFSGVHEPANENDAYTIRYEEFVVPLVKAVQELNVGAETQQDKLMNLVNQITGDAINLEILPISQVLFETNAYPALGQFDLTLVLPDSVSKASLTLSTLNGKKLKNLDVNDRGTFSFPVSSKDLMAGMYQYTLTADEKVVEKKRLILK
jgi:trimeric autotransporter adhesin